MSGFILGTYPRGRKEPDRKSGGGAWPEPPPPIPAPLQYNIDILCVVDVCYGILWRVYIGHTYI